MKKTDSKPISSRRAPRSGFTLVEMLVVIGVIAILASLLMPALARAKGKARQAKCLNNIRQLGLAATLYTDDFGGELPPRRERAAAWPNKLKPYFIDGQILTCPNDRFGFLGIGRSTNQEPNRSFLINGFNDYFVKTLSPEDYQKHRRWQWPHGMKASEISRPSDTLILGEKRTGSRHVHMDIDQGRRGNDLEEIEHQRHSTGSNFAFADNSVRLLKKNQELYPENLWAVLDEFRHPPAPPQ
jgi:prepilin-type N-terminal cleavage/methylation domain-containing protein/prepilin-type processing-associated H-X9-DG protein